MIFLNLSGLTYTALRKSPKHPFEYNVLMFASIIGLIRSIVAVIGDLDDIVKHPDFYSDIAFTLIFCFVIIALRTSLSFQWIVIFFYIPFIWLLIYAFHNSNGLQQGIEQNIFAGLIFIIFTLKGRLPVYFSAILIVGIFFSVVLLEIRLSLLENFEDNHTSDLNFIFASLGIIGLTYYAKYILVKGRNKLKDNRYQLKMKTFELENKHKELQTQKEALEELALSVDKRVSQRTKALNLQKKRREKYLSITSTELNQHFEKTIASIEKIELKHVEESFLQMLYKSGNSLTEEIRALKEKVIEGHG